MSSLQLFNDNGLELVIDLQTNEAFATQSGYARMSGKSQQAINKRCNTYNQEELKTAELLTVKGFKTYNLIPANLVYDWLLKDNLELAKTMGKAGATIYIHQLAGYKITSTAIQQQKQHTLPQSSEAIQQLKQLKEMHDFAVSIGNVRMQAQFETAIQQLTDVYVLPQSEKQPILKGQPTAPTGHIQYEGVVDVVIRLGLKFDNRFESALGTYAGKSISHLRVSTNDESLKDYRASQASGKVIPAYMYPAFNTEVEQVVRDFCAEMESKHWMTQAEIKAAKKSAKLAALSN